MSLTPRPPRRRRARAAVLMPLLALGLLAAAVRPAHAQGTNGLLPDPISGHDLSAYARRLGLSDQQRLAADRFHEAYLERFRELREGEIEQFIADSGNLMRSFMYAPDTKAMRKGLTDFDRVSNRIRILDDGFFGEVQTVLTETQMEALPTVRDMRERARYRTGLVRFAGSQNPATQVDLGELLFEIDLAPDDRAAVDPLVRDYEIQLTTYSRKLHRTARDMFEHMAKQIDDLLAQAPPDPNGRPGRGMWRAMRDVWGEGAAEVMVAASEISDLNRRSFRNFRAVLPFDPERHLLDEYWSRAYPEVQRGLATWMARYDEALRLDELAAELRSQITATRDQYYEQYLHLADQTIDLVDEQRKERLPFGGRGPDEEREKLARLAERRDELGEQADAALVALLGGTEHAEALAASAAAETPEAGAPVTPGITFGSGPPRPAAAHADAGAAAVGASGAAGRFDPYVPGPISAAQAARLADRLALTDEQRTVFTALHADYLEAFATLETEKLAPLAAAVTGLWAVDPETREIKPPSAEEIEHVHDLRAAAIEAVRTLDASFFDDVAVAAIDAEDEAAAAALDAARRARERVVYLCAIEARPDASLFNRFRGRSAQAQPMSTQNRESEVDLMLLLDAASLDAEETDKIAAARLAYDREITDIQRRLHHATMQIALAADMMAAQVAQRRQSGGERPAYSFRGQADMEGAWRELREQREATVALNRRTIDDLCAALGEPDGATLRTAYQRRANPDIYEDPGSIEPFLAAAQALDDLTESQRSQLGDLVAEYRGPYAQLCEEMAGLRAERGDGQTDWIRRREQANHLEQLRFQREELNDKARRRLRSLLTDAQAQRLALVVD